MKVVCLGSINRDAVYEVDHFAAGGETVPALDRNTYWGGKGLNQAVAMARTFDKVYMAGLVGTEDKADILGFLAQNHLHASCMDFCDVPTGHAIICVDRNGQNSITIYGGANRTLDEGYIVRVLERFSPGDIVLVQNETNCLEEILSEATARGLRVAITPAPFDDNILKLPLELVDYFLLNEIEGAQMTGETQPRRIAAAFQRRYPKATLVLTLGSRGALFSSGQLLLTHGTYSVPVVDTTAAGDSFAGYLLSGLVRGIDPKLALEQASKAASLTVSRRGATSSIPTLEEVEEFSQPEIPCRI